jgi:hypothetical protein
MGDSGPYSAIVEDVEQGKEGANGENVIVLRKHSHGS